VATGSELITATLGIPDKIKALLSGAKTVYLTVGDDKAGSSPALTTAAFKKVKLESGLSNNVAKVGVVPLAGIVKGTGGKGALLQAVLNKLAVTINKTAPFILLNIFILLKFE
jgi:hypothetical protein